MATTTSGSQSQGLEANKTSNANLSLSGVSADNSIKIGASDEALVGMTQNFTGALYGVASLVGGIQQGTQETLQALSSNNAMANASLANTLSGNSFGSFLKNNWLYIIGGIAVYLFAKKKGIV